MAVIGSIGAIKSFGETLIVYLTHLERCSAISTFPPNLSKILFVIEKSYKGRGKKEEKKKKRKNRSRIGQTSVKIGKSG